MQKIDLFRFRFSPTVNKVATPKLKGNQPNKISEVVEFQFKGLTATSSQTFGNMYQGGVLYVFCNVIVKETVCLTFISLNLMWQKLTGF